MMLRNLSFVVVAFYGLNLPAAPVYVQSDEHWAFPKGY